MIKLKVQIQICDGLNFVEVRPLEKLADVLGIFASGKKEEERAKKLANNLIKSLNDINDFLG